MIVGPWKYRLFIWPPLDPLTGLPLPTSEEVEGDIPEYYSGTTELGSKNGSHDLTSRSQEEVLISCAATREQNEAKRNFGQKGNCNSKDNNNGSVVLLQSFI